ncbi:hypothetical protein PENSPDRAFT_680434 [Peniophora sp. CONT]|nr:hypothetical protein PENSPDRAFT_680434 [Peniophora sp. CONT]
MYFSSTASESTQLLADPTPNNSGSTPVDAPLQKTRGKLPKSATDMLKDWIHQHANHPYPTEEEKKELCAATGLSMVQLCNWMINARRRILPPLQRAQSQSSGNCAQISRRTLDAPASVDNTSLVALLHQAYLLNDDSDFLRLLSLPAVPVAPPRIEPYCQVLRSQLGFSTRTSFSARNESNYDTRARVASSGSNVN